MTRRFEGFRLTSTSDEREKVTQINVLIYELVDETDDLIRFGLTDKEKRDYDVVKNKFEGHFVVRRNAVSLIDVPRMEVKVWTALSLLCTA